MLEQNKQIFVSFHPASKLLVDPAMDQMRAAGWENIKTAEDCTGDVDIPQLIEQSDMFIVFLSRQYAQNDVLMLEEFSYSSVIERKHFIPVWLDKLDIIQKEFTGDTQLLSALEMLTAKYTGVDLDGLIGALTDFKPFEPKYTPSIPQICEKPCEAYEGDEPYIFISYAHDNAKEVYPHVEALYEAGWDLWYDEGIKTTQRYLPVIADAIKRCTVFVLMLTKRCLERPFVMNYELEYARKRGIKIVPLVLEDAPWSGEPVVKPEDVHEHIKELGILDNRGKRDATPPTVRQNVVYDVVLPPEIPGFEYTVQGYEITITKYVGTETEVDLPGEIQSGMTVFMVTSIGGSAFAECKSLTSITIPDSITSIGNNAFDGCSSLTSITIPNSVASIGNYAFCDCGFTSVTIPDSVTSIGERAFHGCKSLTSVTIPDGVTSIGNGAFAGCRSLTSVTIPDSLKSIGAFAFVYCSSLTSITIPNSVTIISYEAFAECSSLSSVTIPDSIIYIAYDAFQNCPVHIPGRGSVNDIKKPKVEVGSADNNENDSKQKQKDINKIPSCGDKPYALICCAEEDIRRVKPLLIELYWEGFNLLYEKSPDDSMINESGCILAFFAEKTSESKETIAFLSRAIASDSAKIIQIILTGADWPNEVKSKLNDKKAIKQKECTEGEFTGLIRDSLRRFECALGHPRGFEVRNISGGVEVVRFHPTEYTEVIIPKTFFDPPLLVVSIGDSAFRGCRSLTSVAIPNSVTSIGGDAFVYCSSLTSVKIPDSVTSIGERAFYECKSLTSITIPNGVTSIGDSAFRGCRSLTSITIPNGVTSIGRCAFYGCKSLTSITIPDGVTSIGNGAFSGCRSLTSVAIPNSVTSIDGDAFEDCSSLTSVKIPDSVTSISKYAFRRCTSLTIYTPPKSVAWRYAKKHIIKREPLPEPKPPLKPSIFSRIFKHKK